jgi:hypothetical protein
VDNLLLCFSSSIALSEIMFTPSGSSAIASSSCSSSNHESKEVISCNDLSFPQKRKFSFPICWWNSVDDAAEGLLLCNVGDEGNATELLKRQREQSRGRHYHSTIVEQAAKKN